jgi:hypothetical protein
MLLKRAYKKYYKFVREEYYRTLALVVWVCTVYVTCYTTSLILPIRALIIIKTSLFQLK